MEVVDEGKRKEVRSLAALTLVFVLFLSNDALSAARIIYARGKIQVMRKGESFWIPGKPQAVLNEGDRVKAHLGAFCEIALDENKENIVKVDSGTEVVISGLAPAKFELSKGKILSKIERGSSFEVQTPQAVCGVRGTGFGVDTDGKRTVVLVFEDKVYIMTPFGPREERIMDAGYKGTIAQYQRLGSIQFVILTRLEEDRWNTWIRELSERLEEKGRMERIREIEKRYEERYSY